MKKKLLAGLLTIAMASCLFTACGGNDKASDEEKDVQSEAPEAATDTEAQTEEEEELVLEGVTVRIGAMTGPTAMTMVKLMDDAQNGNTEISYEFADLAADPAAFLTPLILGDLDIACVPSNLSSVMYNNTEGGVVVLATCNTGVLYVVERGETVASLSDLAGKTIYMTGQGAVPEYTVSYLLNANGIDPTNDLTIQWCADTTEALSYISADESAIAILPQPFVTAACAQVEDLRVALDLNDEWASVNGDSSIVTGVVVARKDFVEANPNTVKAFLLDYEASIAYTATNTEDAAALIEGYGIVAKAALAAKALPSCNLVCMTGDDLKAALSGFLTVLYDQNPQSVGGTLPADDFYYNY